MMYALAVAAVVFLAAIAFAVVQRRRSPPMAIPHHEWKGDKVTPAALGPRSSAPERVARGTVLTQGVLLAVEMARSDGEIVDSEVNAIHDFIRDHVPEADEALARKVLEDGLSIAHSDAVTDNAIATIRAVGSEEQRRLVLSLLAHLAHVDGRLDVGERAFMVRVGTGLGLEAAEVTQLIEVQVST